MQNGTPPQMAVTPADAEEGQEPGHGHSFSDETFTDERVKIEHIKIVTRVSGL